ncbi:MAG TPA: hypothetical protein DEO88_11220, partial [Syntrophobacteraceae bacterium]|nr:hypothetical protein [Syntrophobacteraceae bacterium]
MNRGDEVQQLSPGRSRSAGEAGALIIQRFRILDEKCCHRTGCFAGQAATAVEARGIIDGPSADEGIETAPNISEQSIALGAAGMETG